jgi:16S rRNA (guanine527-N7)-methyltransferase
LTGSRQPDLAADGSRPTEAPPPPAAAAAVFGDRLPLAQWYASLLASDGVTRGLLGPREVPRLWERHILNCAVVAELVPADARVVDVGSGAGLPGLPMALSRPDLRVDLVEPMLRRSAFLTEAVEGMQLGPRVRVVRGRADERGVADLVGQADWVVARAVAPLDRLVEWCLPLLSRGGRLLALKGARAAEEIAAHTAAVRRLGGERPVIRQAGIRLLDEPTTIVLIRRPAPAGRPPGRRGERGV